MELTRKELEYLINLCSEELDKSEINPTDIIRTIYRDFDYDSKYLDGRKLSAIAAVDELLNIVVDVMSDEELNKFIKKMTRFTAFRGTYNQKNLTFSNYTYGDGVLRDSEFIDCKILIDLQTVPSDLFYNANMTNCEITISDKCEVLEDHCICIYGENNKIMLPESVYSIGKQRSSRRPARSTSNVIVYQGTKKEFGKIDKAGRIDFTVQCTNGTVKYS